MQLAAPIQSAPAAAITHVLSASSSTRYTAPETPRTLEHDMLRYAVQAVLITSLHRQVPNESYLFYKDGSLGGLRCMAHVEHIPMGAAHDSLLRIAQAQICWWVKEL